MKKKHYKQKEEIVPVIIKKSGKKRWLILGFCLCLSIYSIFVLFRDYQKSSFYSYTDRVNIVVFGKKTNFYSLGMSDNINYMVSYYPDMRVEVPGGYGLYRIGALGKFLKLEKNPELLKRTFSSVTSTFITYYFYDSNDEIYYGKDRDTSANMPSMQSILFSNSNANIVDRLAILFAFSQKKSQDIRLLTRLRTETDEMDDIVFNEKSFRDLYLGYFYQNTYRREKNNIQIVYGKSYKTVQRMSDLLEGNGIRVSDYTYSDNPKRLCQIVEDKDIVSQTAKGLSRYFGCQIVRGNTDIYDIIFHLGDKERDWQVSS
ncbi:MAG: hypothetical protein WCO06_00105 [Candidatus Roizmanbacteria bacterium]